ncbi:SCP-like extracellular [Gracilaria domingensis]|nr:SCP-like extracellular [Gracilaria domingensis]
MNATDQRSHPSLDKILPGKYLSLPSIAKSFPSSIGSNIMVIMEGCPESIEILNVAPVSKEGPSVYEIDYNSGLRVDNQKCFALQGAAMTLKLYPTHISDESSGTSFPVWLGMVPENTVKCGPEPAPKVTISVIQALQLLNSFSLSGSMLGMEKSLQMHSNFSLVMTLSDTVCPYFAESDTEIVEALFFAEALIQKNLKEKFGQHGGKSGAATIDPETILHSHFEFKQLCPCQSHFPRIISLLPASLKGEHEVDMNDGKNVERAIQEQNSGDELDDAEKEEGERMPMPIKWNGNLCPSKSIYSIGDVVSYDDKMLKNDSAKRLMVHGVVEKLFDEIRNDYASLSTKFSFEGKRASLMKFGPGLEGMRGVIPFRRGSKCGAQDITEDFVLLLEVYHILLQLSNSYVGYLIDEAKWNEILNAEQLSPESATLHVFTVQNSNDLDVCTYTASLRTRQLFAGKCQSFVPLGKRDPQKITSDEEDRAQTFSPSITPSPIYPSATPSSSLIASPTASSSITPTMTIQPSPSSSPSASSSQVKPSISTSPSPSSSIASSTSKPSETDDSDSACFPGAAKVRLMDGSIISMAELRIGDYIVDGSGESSRVLAFAHANGNVESTFVLINFESGALPISAQHYLPVNGVLASAESVKVGDFIKILNCRQFRNQSSHSAQVTAVERVSMTGLYNPQTASGSIAVFWKGSAVVTSTYTRAVDPAVAHLMMWPLRWLDRFAGIVIPLLAHILRDGSTFWKRLLPEGSAKLIF